MVLGNRMSKKNSAEDWVEVISEKIMADNSLDLIINHSTDSASSKINYVEIHTEKLLKMKARRKPKSASK